MCTICSPWINMLFVVAYTCILNLCSHRVIHNNYSFMMDDMFLYHASNFFERCLSYANSHMHIHIMMDDVYIYHAHNFFGLCLFCVGTHEYLSTSQSHELTKRALESNDDLGSHGLPFPPLTSRISSTWPSHGYGLFSITYSMPILLCSLCTICSFLCLCHAFLTHALHCTWWLILILVCVFASLVEIVLVIAMFLLRTIPMMILWSCFVFVLAICHVHCLCPLFCNHDMIDLIASHMLNNCSFPLCPIPMMILWSCFVFVFAICHVHCLYLLFALMTWLPWFTLVCCIFALLACTTW